MHMEVMPDFTMKCRQPGPNLRISVQKLQAAPEWPVSIWTKPSLTGMNHTFPLVLTQLLRANQRFDTGIFQQHVMCGYLTVSMGGPVAGTTSRSDSRPIHIFTLISTSVDHHLTALTHWADRCNIYKSLWMSERSNSAMRASQRLTLARRTSRR